MKLRNFLIGTGLTAVFPSGLIPRSSAAIGSFIFLFFIKVKKADQSKVLSYQKIVEVIEECASLQGDIYDKAVCLMRGIVKKHPFASGNRRTAFISTKDFLISNGFKFEIKDNPHYARVMQGIREDYYSLEELKDWIKNGQIKEFKR